MMQRRFILYLAFLLTVLGVSAANFQLMQPRNVVEGRNFALTFRLTDGEANPPAAPELEGCKLLYGPTTSTMQSTEIMNGRMTSTYSIDYTFTYRAEKAGEVHVPAVTVSCEGKSLSSRAATFSILPADRNQQSQGGYDSGSQSGSASSQASGRISADDLFVRVSFSKSSVYEQEPVVATIKVYTSMTSRRLW